MATRSWHRRPRADSQPWSGSCRPAALLIGIALLAVIMRRMKKRDTGGGPTDADLGDYLAQVDRDLGLDNAGGSTASSGEQRNS